MNIKITSDSTCDLPRELLEQNHIDLVPLIVMKEDQEYLDNVTITPSEIFRHVANGGSLCTTAARSVAVYQELFRKYADSCDGHIHISLGSGFSSSYQNAFIAAQDFPNVRVVDSRNLSCGQGLTVLKALELSRTMENLDDMVAALNEYAEKVETSFVLDRLDYMVKGGRCSTVAALGANLLNLKPCLEVKDGKLTVVKKYRGSFAKCIAAYCKDRLEGREDVERSTGWLLYTQVEDEIVAQARKDMAAFVQPGPFGENVAGCTISCHCGPNTLGVLFARK